MASFNHFVLLLLLIITLILSAEATKERRAIPSKAERNEMKRQLKAINKPAIKSFKTEHGDIFDCIDIHKQLAFDHHLLKNHSVQLRPTTVPEYITGNNISESFSLLQEGISCPDGTVIVKRTTMQDLMHAQRLKSMGFEGPRPFLTETNNMNFNGKFYDARADYGPNPFAGVAGNINIWKPKILQDQVSIGYMAVSGGPIEEDFASISVGWIVNPSMHHGDHVRLYAYWTLHGSSTGGCYGMSCPGFVQVSKTIPVGAVLQPFSIYNGRQYELRLGLFQDSGTGNWWFVFKEEIIGYWPASLFKSWMESNSANYASWGGQVYSPIREKSPPMGSGHWPSEGFHKAAFISGLKLFDGHGKVYNPGRGTVKLPVLDLTQPIESSILSSLSEACKEWGFFYVTNHGISKEMFSKICSLSRDVFKAPLESKLKLGPISYTPRYIASPYFESLVVSGPDFSDSAKASADVLFQDHHKPELRETMQEYGAKMAELSKRLIKILLMMTLGDETGKRLYQTDFSNCHGYLRLVNYTPPHDVEKQEELVEGLGMHTDMSCITIVYQDSVGGLQMRSKEGKWIDINPCNDFLVVNIGDLMQAWSNGRLRSSEHRVVLRKLVNRVSLAFFLCFEDEKVILAPQEIVGEGKQRSYKSFKCSEYLKFRQSNEEGKFEKIGFTVKDFAGLKLAQPDDP